jgi:sterol desaturase/sphingolipid hydroxylase (fatty acid hydroxylase superfamily)
LPVLERLGLLGNPVFAFLYRHHLHHHRLARMRWVNFNISIPLSDCLFGTLETEAAWQTERDRRTRARANGGADTARDVKSQAS